MKTLIEKLKKSDKIKSIYITKDYRLACIENINGVVININAKTLRKDNGEIETYGYQWSFPIKPNTKTGSGVAGTGDYYSYIDFNEMVNVAENKTYSIPNFYSPKEMATIKWQSLEDNLKNYTFYSVKIK